MLNTKKLYLWFNESSFRYVFDIALANALALKSNPLTIWPRVPHLSVIIFEHKQSNLKYYITQSVRLSYFDSSILYLRNFSVGHRTLNNNILTLAMSKQRTRPNELVCAAEDTSDNEDILELDENVSLDDVDSNHMEDSDSDICVVFDMKEQQSKAAVEIVIDDDDNVGLLGNLPTVPVHVRNPDFIPLSRPRPCSNRPNAESTSMPDYVSLCSNNSNPPKESNNTMENFEPRPGLNRRSTSRYPTIGDEEVDCARIEVEKYRYWDYTNLGSGMVQDEEMKLRLNDAFSVMSYNVLAQSLLDGHQDLYKYHNPSALSWDHRSRILFKELKMANPDILCLQEVQTSHMDTFYSTIKELGYDVVHKQRTGDKGDGVAIYYKTALFALKESTTVEFYQPGVPILNRDNVAIVVKLRLKDDSRKRCIVVATTHLLFNPRRHDVKLAQTQILLAEVERFAYEGQDRNGDTKYCPSIITGDMNFEPYTGVYELLATGSFRYEGLSSHSLSLTQYGQMLDRELIPHYLEITDTCQHYSMLTERPNVSTFDVQRKNIKLYSSEDRSRRNQVKQHFRSFDGYMKEMVRRGCVNNFTPNPNCINVPTPAPYDDELQERCGTGKLSHGLNLRSVYSHGHIGSDQAEVTTHQDNWKTVDYIFYGCRFSRSLDKVIEGDLKLISRLKLPKAYQAARIGPIPNAAVPSDHYPLAAVFLLI